MFKKISILFMVFMLLAIVSSPAYALSFGSIIDDAKDWGKGAVEDVKDWSKGAAEDVSQAVDKALKDEPEIREIDTLPVLNINLNTMTNVQTAQAGSFNYGDNVKQKKLPPEAANELKRVLMRDNGFTEYWADFVVNKASELGEEPGEAVVGLLPYSEYYGDRIVAAINKAVAKSVLSEVNPYQDGIIPVDKLQAMDFVYTVDTSKANLSGSNMVIITGVQYGTRDNFAVTVKSGGREYPAVKKALNGKEIVFVAEVPNIKDLSVIYKSNFKLPQDAKVLMHEVTADIARKLQKKINNLSPLGDPISNDARDVLDKLIYEAMFAKFEYLAKAQGLISGENVTVNDMFANGDVGVFVTDAIKLIPGVDQLLTVSGWDNKLADAIRDVVGQAEVRTFAELKNGKIYLNSVKFTNTTQQTPAATTPAATTLTKNPDGSVRVIVNGKTLASDVPAQSVNGRTMVPLRPIFEALGAKVYWDSATSTAVGSKQSGNDMIVVKMTINNKIFLKETFGPYVKKDMPLDVPAMVINGRTMVPARVIAESMGEDVAWEGTSNTVIVGTRNEQTRAQFEAGQQNTTLKDKNGKVVYEGLVKDGKKHGYGVYTYADGTIYRGNWYMDKRQGLGTLTYASGNKYEGQWLSDQQHGLGTLTYANGDKYEGQWNYGKKHGKGTYAWANGDVYVGTYANDVRHGYAVMTWASGQVYKGQFVNGQRQ